MEVWGSSWLSAKKGSGGGRGVDEGKREGSIENRKIDLIYEFSVTFGTDLLRCHVFGCLLARKQISVFHYHADTYFLNRDATRCRYYWIVKATSGSEPTNIPVTQMNHFKETSYLPLLCSYLVHMFQHFALFPSCLYAFRLACGPPMVSACP